MISIVMAYYRRNPQLRRTLLSMEKSLYKDFNVIIVDDASEEDIILPEVSFHIDIISISKEEKTWTNPEPAYNRGFYKALVEYSPDIIILQNPECMHIGDVLSYTAENISDENYIPFRCIALDKQTTFDESIDIIPIIDTCQHGASIEGPIAWYNHPVYRNCHLDYCAAISAKNMIDINGYDERFMTGIAYSDNYLVHRIQQLGLRIEAPEFPLVAHQWHYEDWYWKNKNGHLLGQNLVLLRELTQTKETRAQHLITPDFENITH